MFKAYVLTISDKGSRGERIDTAGPAVVKLLQDNNFEVVENTIIPDDYRQIVDNLNNLVDRDIDLVITAGGTGFSPRDVTPEATKAVITRETPGLNEMMRFESSKVTNRAWLSRATSGIKAHTLIVNLPGSEKAARENLSFILPVLEHGLKIMLAKETDCGGK